MKNENNNPLSSYGVSDEEFEFYEKLYEFEHRSFAKGFITSLLIILAVCTLVAIIM